MQRERKMLLALGIGWPETPRRSTGASPRFPPSINAPGVRAASRLQMGCVLPKAEIDQMLRELKERRRAKEEAAWALHLPLTPRSQARQSMEPFYGSSLHSVGRMVDPRSY